MAPESFDRILATETLDQICFYIDDSHRPTLFALSLVNKCMRSVAIRSLFSNVVIYHDIMNPDLLLISISQLQSTVQSHIRSLKLASIQTKGVTSVRKRFEQVPFVDMGDTIDEDYWFKIAEFITSIHHLSDFNFHLRMHFPSCLLAALHQTHPTCKLRLGMFQLSYGGYPRLHRHEPVLATSPCLYGISTVCGDDTRTLDAIIELAVEAPNLSELEIFHDVEYIPTSTQISSWKPPRVVGNLEHGNQSVSASPGQHSLRHLSLDYPDSNLLAWSKSIDTSTLRVLELLTSIDHGMLEYMARDCSFKSLKSLTIALDGSGPTMRNPQYETAIADLFAVLPPLKFLIVTGKCFSETLEAMLEHQGHKLKDLRIEPSNFSLQMGSYEVEEIASNCPELEHLSLTVTRSKGRIHESKVFEMLGSIRTLRTANITLDTTFRMIRCPSIRHADGSLTWHIFNDTRMSEREQEIISFHSEIKHEGRRHMHSEFLAGTRRGFLEETLINHAIDEKLAKSIFNVISAGKSWDALPLEKLILTPKGAFDDAGGRLPVSFKSLADQVGRSWRVELNQRDDCKGELVAMCLNPLSVDSSPSSRYPPSAEVPPEPTFEKVAEDVFFGVWPKKQNDNEDWWNNWHSFPLELEQS